MSKCPVCNSKISNKKKIKINYGVKTNCPDCNTILRYKMDAIYFVPNLLILFTMMYFMMFVANRNGLLFALIFVFSLILQNMMILLLPLHIKNDTNE